MKASRAAGILRRRSFKLEKGLPRDLTGWWGDEGYGPDPCARELYRYRRPIVDFRISQGKQRWGIVGLVLK